MFQSVTERATGTAEVNLGALTLRIDHPRHLIDRKECAMMPRKALAEAEGDTNLSPRRRAWSETQLDELTRTSPARCPGFPATIGVHAVPVSDSPR